MSKRKIERMLSELETEAIIEENQNVIFGGVDKYKGASIVDGCKVEKLVKFLSQAGVEPSRTVKTRFNGYNKYYIGENIVWVVIKTKSKFGWTMIDRDLYNKKFANAKCSFCFDSRHANDHKVVVNGKDENGNTYDDNKSLHQIACVGHKKGYGVDHIAHHPALNLSEYLRDSTPMQNRANVQRYSNINANNSFQVISRITDKNEKQSYIEQGYKFYRRNGKEYLRSKVFDTREELIQAINDYENKYLGEFRYNPMIDFQETWYTLVIAEFIGGLSKSDIFEYNKNYIRKTMESIAEYYQIGA